jgi:hypothetical protein
MLGTGAEKVGQQAGSLIGCLYLSRERQAVCREVSWRWAPKNRNRVKAGEHEGCGSVRAYFESRMLTSQLVTGKSQVVPHAFVFRCAVVAAGNSVPSASG